MKQKFLEIIDRKEKEMKDTAGFAIGDIRYRTVIDCLNWMKEEVEKIEEWIPVTGKMPTIPDEYYLVCVKNKNKEDGIYIIDFACFSEGAWHRTNTWEDITHWMPLPNPPTYDKTKNN